MKKSGVLFAILFLYGISFAGTYSGGSGTTDAPYLIATAADINSLGADSNDWSKCFKLVADINMAAYTGTQYKIIGTSYSKCFTGTFDGDGYVIRNLTYTSTTYRSKNIGMFGYTIDATIKNLGIEDINISANEFNIGGLIGYQVSGDIINCYSTGVLKSSCDGQVGGLVGYQSNGTIMNSHNSCYIRTSSYAVLAGGISGFNSNGNIVDCYNAGTIIANAPGKYAYAGGLAGQNSGSITNCYNTGSVSASSSYSGAYAGGLVGEQNRGTISNCYNSGTVTSISNSNNTYYAYAYSGGIAGYQGGDGTITKCYNVGMIISSDTSTSTYRYVCSGGMVGYQSYGTIIHCYNLESTSSSTSYGYSCSGGIAGYQAYMTCCNSNIEECYSAGVVSATGNIVYDGGLLGYYGGSGTIVKSLWDEESSGVNDGIGYGSSSGVVGKITEQMKTLTTFTNANWDFKDIWNIGEGQTYPYLRKYQTADLNYDGAVNMFDFAIFAEDWLEE